MARGGARIISGVCAGATALTSTLAWATPQVDAARELVTEAVTASGRASLAGASWSGWTRRGGELEREGWSLRASSIERSGSGWIARGEASLSGPRGLYVKAPRVELDEETVRALATEESPPRSWARDGRSRENASRSTWRAHAPRS